jgi:hypothetical protein
VRVPTVPFFSGWGGGRSRNGGGGGGGGERGNNSQWLQVQFKKHQLRCLVDLLVLWL